MNFFESSHSWISLESGDHGGECRNQVLGELVLHDPLLDQLIKDMEIRGPVVLGVTLCPCGVILKGGHLSLELLIKLLQLNLLAKDVAVENNLLSLAI